MEVVGVVADVRSIDVAQAQLSSFQLYKPAAQDPAPRRLHGCERQDRWPVSRRIGQCGDRGGGRRSRSGFDRGALADMSVTATVQEVTSQMALMQQLLMAFAVPRPAARQPSASTARWRGWWPTARTRSACGWRSAPRSRTSSAWCSRSGGRIVAIGAGAGLLGAFGLSRLLGVGPADDGDRQQPGRRPSRAAVC